MLVESKVHYSVVGFFVVLLGSALIAVFFWLTTVKHDKVYKTYLVYVHEEVTGLSLDSPVRYNGVPVGYVKSVKLDPNNPQLVRIILLIEEGTPITTSTVATLRTQGITGVLYLGLKAKTENAPLLRAKRGEPYPIIPAEPSLLVQLSEVLPRITHTVNNIGKSVEKILSAQNQQALSDTLQNMSKFTDMLADNSKSLDATVKSLRVTLKNTEKASAQFPKTMDNLNDALDSVDSAANEVKNATKKVGDASESFGRAMTQGETLMNSLNTQIVPSTQQLLMQLNGLTTNLQGLSEKVLHNPSILVRGANPPAPGPGEQ